MLFVFVTPVVLIYALIFLYPTIRTVLVSLFNMTSLSAPLNSQNFVGLQNYLDLLNNDLFKKAFVNVLLILFVGGASVFIVALFFANVLARKMRGKKFFRAIIYLPNVITPVALVIMWTQYIFNNRFGMLHSIFSYLGLNSLADFPWLSQSNVFWAMLIAFCFGAVGYYMVLFMAAIEQVPMDYYECASIEGAGKLTMFFRITLPLLRDTARTAVMFWCISALNFFVWAAVFTQDMFFLPIITPSTFMIGKAFGGQMGTASVSSINVGLSSAVGIVLTLCAVIIFFIVNIVFKQDKLEY